MIGIYIFALVFGLLVVFIDLAGLLSVNDDGSDISDLDAEDQGVVLPDNNKGAWVYGLLNLLRSFVYFCCGFGSVGVFGVLTDTPQLKIHIFSIGTGIVLLGIVKFLSKIQSRVTDSQLTDGDLLYAQGEVLVSITPGKLGKVRVFTGGSYHDLFAKGLEQDCTYIKGSAVFVVDTSSTELIVHTIRN